MHEAIPFSQTALVLVDLQNDFIDPKGAYGRAGQGAAAIAALPDRLAPLADAMRRRAGGSSPPISRSSPPRAANR